VGEPLADLARYFADYMVLDPRSIFAMAVWVQAAHFIGEGDDKGPWDQFPILVVTSPEKRCGKSTLLDLLLHVTPRAEQFVNPTEASITRRIEKTRPTIIMDEAQSMKRRGSEMSIKFGEMLCASVRRDVGTSKCVGDNNEPAAFSIYSPKVFAQIGEPDGVLADRCLPIRLERKGDERRTRFRLREAKERGHAIRDRLHQWKTANAEKIEHFYGAVEPLGIANDRLADMMTSLQAVVKVAGGLALLEEYAKTLDEKDRQAEMNSDGVRLLMAIREVFGSKADDPMAFIQTHKLIDRLCQREEEPWREFNRGRPITPERLASTLKDYKIHSSRTTIIPQQTGYYAGTFHEAWARYLPPPSPKNPAIPAIPARADRPEGYEAMLRTLRWQRFSGDVRKMWGGRCAVCYAAGPLQVHHRTYERFGHEELTDCLPLCGGCHPLADVARKAATG
jgi:putative DNA primase/helicase